MEIDDMFETQKIQVDFCVVGGGLAGMCAALAAARSGCRVLLMHDRPVPGGNASGEIRMWVCGAHGENMRESGIIEELLLENLYRNPGAVPAIWDSVLYGVLEYAENLQLLLNCSCLDAVCDPADGRIRSVRGWQTTTQTFYEVEAKYFADCSGDSVLAPLSGAEYRIGRESCHEFNESIEPEIADNYTMGSSCLFQARQLDHPVKFIPPEWARKFTSLEQLPQYRNYQLVGLENFWWMEIGGMSDTIHDTEKHRHYLLELAFGIWDYIKNHAPEKADNECWELDWVGFLPGKRESRRYVGDYIMNQNDVDSGGKFDDIIAYGGWSMDDHNPGGFEYSGQPTIFHPAPSPYGITYRALYSRNVPNLFCAGRNISVSHAVLSSTRVMATCAILGQSCGTAAAIAVKENLSPREVGQQRIWQLQQQLLTDDCYLPGVRRQIPELTVRGRLQVSNNGNAEALRDGFDRVVGSESHAWNCVPGDWAEYSFDQTEHLSLIRIVLDSDLNRPEKNIVALRTWNQPILQLPSCLIRSLNLEYKSSPDGPWQKLCEIRNNCRRLLQIPCNIDAAAIRMTVNGGDEKTSRLRIFSWDVK